MSDLRFKALGISDKKRRNYGFFWVKFIGCNCTFYCGLASWCVAFEPCLTVGLEETPPTCRIAVPMGQGESLGYGAETKRPT